MLPIKTKSGLTIRPVLFGRSNVLLLSNGEKNILIDSSPSQYWKKLNLRLRKLGIDRIDYLVLTHTHFDHSGNARKIQEKYNAKVLVHNDEAGLLASGKNIVPEGTNPLSRIVISLFLRPVFPYFTYEPCKPDILVGDSFDLREFGFNAYILHTPGHTPGSMSVIADNEVAIVGDTMIGVSGRSVFPPFVNDVPGLFRSWAKLLETDCSLFIPSHGRVMKRALVEKDLKKRG
jgi:hydroxyacylglutathione hydrolase